MGEKGGKNHRDRKEFNGKNNFGDKIRIFYKDANRLIKAFCKKNPGKETGQKKNKKAIGTGFLSGNRNSQYNGENIKVNNQRCQRIEQSP